MRLTLRYDEQTVDISWCDLLLMIANVNGNLLLTANHIQRSHVEGLTWSSDDLELMIGRRALHDALVGAIGDEALRDAYQAMIVSLFELLDLNNKITRWIMYRLKIAEDKLTTPRKRANLHRRINEKRYAGQMHWWHEAEYQAMADESLSLVKRMRLEQRVVHERASALYLEHCPDGPPLKKPASYWLDPRLSA